MIRFDKTGCEIEYRKITGFCGKPLKIMIVRREDQEKSEGVPGVLWLHGGGYLSGFPEMAFMSRAVDLVRKCGAVLVCPEYHLSIQAPYPAALADSYRALLYMKKHAEELGIRPDQIMVGGESAGGGLTAALCIYARDKKEVRIAYQMPLYPMLDCDDTPSSRDNHAKVWNTRKNHFAWKLYLRSLSRKKKRVSPYASPAKCENYEGLPPAYTFVGDAEPFYSETLSYIENLQKAGIPAKVDVYPKEYHAFDMMEPYSTPALKAAERFCDEFQYAAEHYFAPQEPE
ncbi:MAG: alpha/beta hydrolase [Bariatricus sp.]